MQHSQRPPSRGSTFTILIGNIDSIFIGLNSDVRLLIWLNIDERMFKMDSHLTWLAEHIGFCDERTMVTNSSSWLQRWWHVFVRAMITPHSCKPPCHRRSLLHQNQTFLVWLVESLSGLWSRSGEKIVLSPEIFCFPECVSKSLVKEQTICLLISRYNFHSDYVMDFYGMKALHCETVLLFGQVQLFGLPSLTALPPPAWPTGPPASFWAASCLWIWSVSNLSMLFFSNLLTVNWQSLKTGVLTGTQLPVDCFADSACLRTDKCNSLQKVCPIFPQSARPL